jgi:hypothetical protein
MKIDKIHDLKGVAIEDRAGISTRYKLTVALVVFLLIAGITAPLMYQAIVVKRVMTLIDSLSSNDPSAVNDAVRRLSAYDRRWTIRLMIARYGATTDDQDPRRLGISNALAMIGDIAVDETVLTVRSPDRCIAARDASDAYTMRQVWPNIRFGCINAAEKMGAPGKRVLQAALYCGDFDVQQRAIEVFAKMKDPSCIPVLLQMQRARVVGVQQLTDLIAGIGSAAVAPLTTALESSDASMNALAAQILGRLPGTASVNALVAALSRSDPGLRMAAASALGALGDPRAAPALVKLQDDDSPGLRMVAAASLGAIGDPRATAALVKLLDDDFIGVKSAAAEALGRVGGDTARQALLERLSAADPQLRWDMAVALERIGGDDARAAVDSLSSDADLKAIAADYGSAVAGLNSRSSAVTEPVIIIALERYGSIDMAASLARSPSTVLQDAARFWAKRHNCEKALDALVPPVPAPTSLTDVYGRPRRMLPRPPRPSPTPAATITSTDSE